MRRAVPAMLVAVLVVDRFVLGSDWLAVHAAGDGFGNLLTGMIWLLAARSLGIPLGLTSGVLAAVMIDIDHLPEIFGLVTPVPGTSRIFTHSLATALALLAVSLIDRSRRMGWAGAALGIVAHLTRDLATGTVIFWWPVSTDLVSIPYAAYAGLTAGFALFVGWRSLHEGRHDGG